MENKGLELKKTEKLATALYMLTSFFGDQEPMKWTLRTLAGRLVSSPETHKEVGDILSLLTVAKNAGLVSEMNFEIIHREFSRLLPEPQSLQNLLVSKNPESVQVTSSVSEKLYVSSTIPPANQVSLNDSLAKSDAIKDKELLDIKTVEPKPLKEFGAVAVKKNSRQSIIISLLKRKKEIMIKDVSPLIAGVSEKTIQRELLSMVDAGVLKKEGEKRWSRYSLAD